MRPALCSANVIPVWTVIRTGNREAYLSFCRGMLEQSSDEANKPDVELTIKAIALVPNAIPSFTKPLELARKLVEKDKNNLSYQRLMGILLFRAGKFPEALPYLTKAAQTDENLEKLDEKYFDATCSRYFLAR